MLNRARSLAILLLCVVTSTMVSGQTETPLPVLKVAVADQQGNDGRAKILDAALSSAAMSGLTLEYVESEASADVALRIAAEDNVLQLEVILQESPLGSLSPILMAGLTEEAALQTTVTDEGGSDALAGLLLYSAGMCEAALARLNASLPEAEAAFYGGNCALLEGEYAAGAALLREVSEHNSTALGAATNLAWAQIQLGDNDEAFEVMNDLLERIDTDPAPVDPIEALRKRSALYALAFEFDAAIADIDRAITLAEGVAAQAEDDNENDARLARLYVERGQRILLLYEWDRVLQSYNRALELDPEYAEAYYLRGVLYYTQGARRSALPDFERYLELAPEGNHAEDAAQYITNIQVELKALE